MDRGHGETDVVLEVEDSTEYEPDHDTSDKKNINDVHPVHLVMQKWVSYT